MALIGGGVKLINEPHDLYWDAELSRLEMADPLLCVLRWRAVLGCPPGINRPCEFRLG